MRICALVTGVQTCALPIGAFVNSKPACARLKTMYKLVLIRHGESQWNLENRFTGWTDVDLTDTGREQARKAGELLKQEGYEFDLVLTSVLKRAIRPLWIALDPLDAVYTPVGIRCRLNDRYYGNLRGVNRSKAHTYELP